MLIGEKVCLGPLLNGDGPLLFNWFDTLEIVSASGPYRPTTEAKFAQWLAGASGDATRVLFAIRRQGDLRLLGHLHICNINPVMRSADVGLGIGLASDRRKGYGQEALRLAIGYCWRELNLQRVALTVLSTNPWAQHAYAKVGFEVEGRLRRATYVDGRHHDVIIMSILRAEGEP